MHQLRGSDIPFLSSLLLSLCHRGARSLSLFCCFPPEPSRPFSIAMSFPRALQALNVLLRGRCMATVLLCDVGPALPAIRRGRYLCILLCNRGGFPDLVVSVRGLVGPPFCRRVALFIVPRDSSSSSLSRPEGDRWLSHLGCSFSLLPPWGVGCVWEGGTTNPSWGERKAACRSPRK